MAASSRPVLKRSALTSAESMHPDPVLKCVMSGVRWLQAWVWLVWARCVVCWPNLGVFHAPLLSLKAFRAGKVTLLVASGVSLGVVALLVNGGAKLPSIL